MKEFNWQDNVEIPLTGINVGNGFREDRASGSNRNTSDMASLKVFDDQSSEPGTDAARWPIPFQGYDLDA